VYKGDREVSIRRLPLARGIIETQANRTQGILGVVPEVAPDLVFPPLAAVTTQLCFFTLTSSNWRYEGDYHRYPDTLVGVVQSKSINDQFMQGFPNRVTVHGEQDTAVRLIQLLQRGRIDTLVEEKTSIDYILSRNPTLPPLRQAGCGEEKPEYIAFSPATQDPQALAIEFAERLEKLRRSGRIDAILQRYGTTAETRGGMR
jgi:polar amino acid transport system substrate-binding protein